MPTLKSGSPSADPEGDVAPPTNRTKLHPAPRSRLLAMLQALLAIVLLAVATLPLSAPAVSPAPARAEADFLIEEASEEGEEEEWELEEDEEEGEEEEESASGTTASLPPDCLLRTAEPIMTAQLASGSLRLTLRYTAQTPTKVGVSYWLKSSKGALKLGSATRRLNRQGVLHLNGHLDERGIARARTARVAVVDLDVPAAPSSCEPRLTLHLNARDLRGSRATWSERRAA